MNQLIALRLYIYISILVDERYNMSHTWEDAVKSNRKTTKPNNEIKRCLRVDDFVSGKLNTVATMTVVTKSAYIDKRQRLLNWRKGVIIECPRL